MVNDISPEHRELEIYRIQLKEFFRVLDKKETSDNGVTFSPNYISSCRVLDGIILNKVMAALKETLNEGYLS